ncbi:MAG: TolC family protein [Bryobacteraceae bacterium]|nr:TolC family protein [Bryobacteraceae bacterium]
MPTVILALGIALPGHAGQAQPGTTEPLAQPLTLDACVRIALDENPLNRAAKEGVEVAADGVGEARAPYYPDLRLRSSYVRWQRHAFLPSGVVRPGIPNTIGPVNDWSGGGVTRLTLFDFGERRAGLRAAHARLRAAEEDAETVRQDIVLEVHRAYFNLAAAIELDSVADGALGRAEDHLRLAVARKEVGAVPQVDVLRAQVEVADARVALERTHGLARVARGALNTAMGLRVETPVAVEGASGRIVPPAEINVAEALENALLARPELKAVREHLEVARSGVAGARSAFGPKIRGEAGFGWRDETFYPNDKDWSVGVSLELPLFTGFANKHRLAQRKHELSREEAELERAIQNVQLEVWSAHSKLVETHAAFLATEPLVREARESLRLATERYEVGAGTINDLLDAEAALARAEAMRAEAEWGYQIAHSTFRRSVGNLVAETNP